MPPIRLSTSERYALLTISIFLDGKIMSPYSYYIKKGLVYIAIISLISRQPSSCFKYIKANTRLSCNVRSVLFNKYRFSYYACHYAYKSLWLP